MTRLSHLDADQLLDAVRELYAQTDLNALPQVMVALQHRLVPCDISTYNEIDTSTNELRVVDDFPGHDEAAKLFPQFMAHLHEYPISEYVARTGDQSAVKISDFLTQRQFQRLGLFNEFFRHFGIRYQMAFFLPGGAGFPIAMGLQRFKRDFTERDRLVLNHLRRHFGQAWQNAKALSLARHEAGQCARVFAREQRGLVFLDRELRITGASTLAQTWLNEYFSQHPTSTVQLPDFVRQWIRSLSANGGEGLVGRVQGPLIRRRGERCLVIRWMLDGAEGSWLVLTEARESPPGPDPVLLGLTPREGEVLHWLTEGKSNPEIGVILGRSTNTVRKHVERILTKLEVDSRAKAVRRVWDLRTEL